MTSCLQEPFTEQPSPVNTASVYVGWWQERRRPGHAVKHYLPVKLVVYIDSCHHKRQTRLLRGQLAWKCSGG